MSPERNTAKAETTFERSLAVAGQQQAKSWELRAVISLCKLWRRQGKTSVARQQLTDIYDWFSEGFESGDLQAAKALQATMS